MSASKDLFYEVFNRHRTVLDQALDRAAEHLDWKEVVPLLLQTREGRDILGFFIEDLRLKISEHPADFLTSDNEFLREYAKLVLNRYAT